MSVKTPSREEVREARRRAREALEGRGDPLALALAENVRRLFPGRQRSWYERVLTRCFIGAERSAPYAWRLPGIRELGDRYPLYNVVYTRSGWYCDCYARRYGWRRSSNVCTHVAAVIVLSSTEAKLKW